MNKLDELLTKLCSKGVEYKSVSELFNTRNGYTPSKSHSKYWKNGTIPWFRMDDIRENGRILSRATQYVSESAVRGTPFPANSIIVATSATIGEHALIKVPSLANQRFTYLMLKEEYNTRIDIMFVYYYCFKLDEYCKVCLNQGNFASVDMKKFVKFKFPVPPLEVQREIVRILDSFTSLTSELTAELTARKKQYDFYRDKLLTYNKECPMKPLADLGKWTGGKTPSMAEKRFWEDGTIPWISSKDMKASILSDTQDHITEKAVKEASMTVYPANSIAVVTRSGILKHTFPVAYVPFETTVNQDIKMLVVNKNILARYAFHVIQGKGNDILTKTKKQGGTVDSLDFQKVLAYKVPVPSIEVQRKLVEVLDNFEAICTDLNIGLPAEIEARQKQYEYYRDLLLTFAEADKMIGGGYSENLIKLFQYVFGYVYLTLDKISENCDRQRKPITKGKRETGKYPYYGASGIVDYVSDYIFDGDYLLVSEDGANLLARSTPIAFSISGKNWVNNHAHVLKFNTYELRRYVEIYLNSIDLSKYISGGAQPKLNQENLNKISIPVPSADRVKYVVAILDRFDTLCNDLSAGLPAEIEARQKQYEYYRDKLLFFKEIQK
jgi:type I restriction enzyme S subunit